MIMEKTLMEAYNPKTPSDELRAANDALKNAEIVHLQQTQKIESLSTALGEADRTKVAAERRIEQLLRSLGDAVLRQDALTLALREEREVTAKLQADVKVMKDRLDELEGNRVLVETLTKGAKPG